MQVSPTEGCYIIEAKINPLDIGQLHIGERVSVNLDALEYTIYCIQSGELTYLSTDTPVEQGQNGSSQVYYRAKVALKLLPDSSLSFEDIKAGMTVTVDVLTDKRSVLSYMTKPITQAFSGALS